MPQLQFNPDWAALTAANVEKVKRGMAERELGLLADAITVAE